MDKENEGRYDDLFGAILQQEGKMEPFFDHVFNFLFRRTDFYITMKAPTDRMGFSPGRAEMIVRDAFKKYETSAKARELRAQQSAKQKNITHTSNSDKKNPAQDSVQETQREERATSVPVEKTILPPKNITTDTASSEYSQKCSAVTEEGPLTDIGDTYNGGVTDTHRWSQNLTEVDVLVDLPVNTKPKDVTVVITNTHLRVSVNTADQQRVILIEGDLPYKVLTDSSIWMVESGVIHVSLEKAKERMWGCVFEGEKEIDLTKVDSTKDISDLDPESQAAVNRVIFDQHQKNQGKPQSHEIETYSLLEKAWDVEGSPFKGTPFDPSKVNISNSSQAL